MALFKVTDNRPSERACPDYISAPSIESALHGWQRLTFVGDPVAVELVASSIYIVEHETKPPAPMRNLQRELMRAGGVVKGIAKPRIRRLMAAKGNPTMQELKIIAKSRGVQVWELLK